LENILERIREQPVNFRNSLEHRQDVGFGEPGDMAIGVGLPQTAQQGSSANYISHGRELDDQDPGPKGSIVRTPVALPAEDAGFVSKKISAVVVDKHIDLRFTIDD
jgi:hypothetical protein